MKIEKAQHIESAIKLMKSGSAKHRQQDFAVVCNDLSRGMGRLMLQVSLVGTATFRYVQKVAGKRSYVVIGPYSKDGRGGVTLAEARQIALSYGAIAKKGDDVKSFLAGEVRKEREKLEAEERERGTGTFGQLIDSYIQSMKADGKRTWSQVFSAIEKNVFPIIDPALKAHSVTDDQVISVLASMIDRGAETQSNRIRSYLHAAFNTGLQHDKDPKKRVSETYFDLKINPVSFIPKQRHAEKVGERYLDKTELKKFLHLLNQASGISEWTANILKLCLFTGGQRPYEILTLKPGKVDFEQRVFEISEDFSKNKRSHLVPMTDTVQDLMHWFTDHQKLKDADFLIYNRLNLNKHFRTDSLGTALDRFRAANKFTHFAPRDLRRTCKTHLGRIGISKEIRDRIQNHAFTDVSSRHYDRWDYLPEKSDALEQWEEWLLNL